MRSKFFIVGSIIFFILIFSFNFITSAPDLPPLSIDKQTYEIDETVIISINMDPNQYYNYYLSIMAQNNSYDYKGDFNPVMFFYPTEEGIYTIALVEKSAGAIFYSLSFKVIGNGVVKQLDDVISREPSYGVNTSEGVIAPGGTEEYEPPMNQEPVQASLISTDKKSYFEGEQVRVYVNILENLPDYEQVSLYHSFNGVSKKYMGDLHYVSFIPQGVGLHEMVLRDAKGDVLYEYAFEIMPPSGKRMVKIFNSRGDRKDFEMNIIDEQNSTGSADLVLNNVALKEVKLRNLRLAKGSGQLNLSLGIDDVPVAKARIKQKNVLKAFAIDASQLNFINGTATGVAVGNELWKCKDWNFEMQQCLGFWQKIMDLTPGQAYEFEISPEDPGYAETGVASINTKKSIYHPLEEAEFIIVVLDTQGHLVENADVAVAIVNPENNTLTLTTLGGGITETQRGIYEGAYFGTSLEGNYSITVTANAINVNSTMLSSFVVKSFYEFDIIRDAPVTTDPWKGAFTSTVRITSHTPTDNGVFDFVELLPINFTILDFGGAMPLMTNDALLLRWSGLTNNSVISYSALPPLVTPELFELGPSFVEYTSGSIPALFSEARPWYIAIDPVVTSSDLESGTIQYGGAGTQVVFFYEPATILNTTYWNDTVDGDWTNSTANACNVSSFRDSLTGLSYLISNKSVVNTSGYSGITFRFTPSVNALDAAQFEYLNASWYDGSAWTTVFTRQAALACGAQQSFNLGGSADNNVNFQMRFACYHNAQLNERCIVDDIRLLGTAMESDVNKSFTNYTNIALAGLTPPIFNITITVNVSYYNNASSVASGNNVPDLDLTLYNGSAWINIGKLSITGTGLFSKSTTNSTILAAWATQANRNLSIRAIYMDYKNSTVYDQINYTDVWVTANYSSVPTVNINLSLDGLFTTNTQPNVNFNYSDTDSLTANCTLYFDDAAYGNNLSVLNYTNTNITVNTPLGDNNYTVYVNCTNIYGAIGKSSVIHIIVDTTGPSLIQTISPPRDAFISDTTPDFIFNASDNLDPVLNCSVSVDGVYVGNNASTLNYTWTNITSSALGIGRHDWSINCTDSAGNGASSSPKTFYIDLTAPTVNINLSLDEWFTNNPSPSVDFNFTDNLATSSNCTLYFDDVPYNFSSGVINNTQSSMQVNETLSDGNYSVYINCTDNATNIGKSSVIHVLVDLTAPQVTPVSPARDAWVNDATVDFLFNTTDSLSSVMNCSVYVDGLSVGSNGSVLNQTPTNISSTPLGEGIHLWSINCSDTAGNIGFNTVRNLTVDLTAPVVNINLSLDGGFTNNTRPRVDFNFNDALAASANCTLYFNETPYNFTAGVLNYTQKTLTVNTTLSASGYDVYVNCTDNATNTGKSTIIHITVDTSGPLVINASVEPYPLNGSLINISANVSDIAGISTVIARIYYPNGTSVANYTMTNTSEAIYWNASFNVNFYPSGTYNITIWANDSVGNINNTVKTNFSPRVWEYSLTNIVIDGAFADWSAVVNLEDPKLDNRSSNAGFDIMNYSIANNRTYLFVRMGMNGTMNRSSNRYYGVYISTNDPSTGNQTAVGGQVLPFLYDYRLQWNVTSCSIYNSTNQRVGSCIASNSTRAFEMKANFSQINMTNISIVNITFMAANGSTLFDIAPNYGSFVTYGSNVSYINADAPDVYINMTLDLTYTTNTLPSVDFNFSDLSDLTANCTLYFNDTPYNFTPNVNADTQTILTVNTSLGDSNYVVYINCTDPSGNTGQSNTIRIGIDTAGPNSSLDLPRNDSVINALTSGFLYTVNASLDDPLSGVAIVMFFYRMNASDSWHYACNATTGPDYFCTWNLTGLSTGFSYEMLVYANDSLGNRGNNNTHGNITVITTILNITSIIVDDALYTPLNQIDLSAGITKTVYCNLTVSDPNDYTAIQGVNATIFSSTTTLDAVDSNRTHYSNTSCTFLYGDSLVAYYQCAFSMWFFAINGTWNCTGFAWSEHFTANNSDNITVNPLFALNVSTSTVDYGYLQPDNVSSNVTVNISNVGNMPMNISVYGFGGDDETTGTGLSMVCQINNITIEFEKFSTNNTANYSSKRQLSASLQDLQFTIPSKTAYEEVRANSTYWQFMAPPEYQAFGQCNGSVVFVAESP